MTPTGRLAEILSSLTGMERQALEAHLAGPTSAEWIATTLTEHGHPVSASTIRTQRRMWRKEGSDETGT